MAVYDNVFGPGGHQGKNPYGNLFAPQPVKDTPTPNTITPGSVSSTVPTANMLPGAPPSQSPIDQYFAAALSNQPSRAQQGLGDMAGILGAFSAGQKADRIVAGDAQGNYDRMMSDREATKNNTMIGRENAQNQVGLASTNAYNEAKLAAGADRRAAETDAFKKLQQATYITDGGAKLGPNYINLGGKKVELPRFQGMEPKGITTGEMAGAETLKGQMLQRLGEKGYEPERFTPSAAYTPDFSFNPASPDKFAKPGLMEKIGSYGAVGSGLLGGLSGMFGGGNKAAGGVVGGIMGKLPGIGKLFGGGSSGFSGLGAAPGLGSTAPGVVNGAGMAGVGGGLSSVLGKAVPIAGAITGGLGLMKDRGVAGNLMNGVTTGASIGSIVPGLGTAVGAGVGALVGGLRSIGGGPSQTELANRGLVNDQFSQLGAQATPEQRAEAAQAGWDKPSEALANIVLRDQLGPQAGEQAMQRLYAQSRVKK